MKKTSVAPPMQEALHLPLPARIPADGAVRVINLANETSEGQFFDSPPSSPSTPTCLSTTSPLQRSSSSSSSEMSHRASGLSVSPLPPPPCAPSIEASQSSSSSSSSLGDTSGQIYSPMERARRTAPPSNSPKMKIHSSPAVHTLQVKLPVAIQPEMVTISANKGAKLKVVADAWHLENDCHYEWLIAFPPHDTDMSGIQAKFEVDGNLTIDVRRRKKYIC